MVQPTSLSRVLAILMIAAATSGCGTDRDAPAGATDAVALREAASDQASKASGLSHLPRPENFNALRRSLARNYPREFIGVRPSTSVLVDVMLDERGFVKDVAVVDRPAQMPDVQVALIDKVPGSNLEVVREYPTTYDASFGPAAVAALKEVRFHPALRDGRPVPFTLRMSVEFTSPAS